jgi:hypothetical protein
MDCSMGIQTGCSMDNEMECLKDVQMFHLGFPTDS